MLAADLTWLGAGAPAVLVLHGRGSTRVNHADYCARLAAAGMSALALDLRGHGDSEGERDAGMLDDVLTALDHLADLGAGPLGIRGSSLGGFLALHAAARHGRVGAVVALCAAPGEGMARRYPELAWTRDMDLRDAVRHDDGVARGYWHARGDELVPWPLSFVLYGLTPGRRRLHVVMGGTHRSLQHDPHIQADTAGWLAGELAHA